jgi:hypothetical protein
MAGCRTLILRDTSSGFTIRNGLNEGKEQKIFEGLSGVEITVCWDVIPFRHCHSSEGKSLDSHGGGLN